MGSYRLRLYAPTVGVQSISVRTTYGGFLGTAYPAGDNVPCFDQDSITSGVILSPALASGYAVDYWIVNEDGSTYTSTSTSLTYNNNLSNAYNVQIRLVVKQSQQPSIGYATLIFNNDGGFGGPGTFPGQGYIQYNQGAPYIILTIPAGEPTKNGYTFSGWRYPSSGRIYWAGNQITLYATTSPPGPSTTLVAVWTEKVTDGGVMIGYGGAWHSASVWIGHGGMWRRVRPKIGLGGIWHDTR